MQRNVSNQMCFDVIVSLCNVIVVFWRHNAHCVSKNDTDMAHYNFYAHQPILFLAEILLSE